MSFVDFAVVFAQAATKLGELDEYLWHPVEQVKDPLSGGS